MKKIGIILAILSVLTLSFITNNNVSALSDLTFTFNSDSNSFIEFCGGVETPSCSGYDYLYITTNYGFNSTSSYVSLYVRYNDVNQTNYRINLNSPSVLVDISDFQILGCYSVGNIASLPSDWSVTLTLSENNPAGGITPEGTLDVVANGTYDVTNYASVDVQVEESSFIVQLFSQGFWGVATAIVTIIVPIIALFLIFRLVHDLLWGRG